MRTSVTGTNSLAKHIKSFWKMLLNTVLNSENVAFLKTFTTLEFSNTGALKH